MKNAQMPLVAPPEIESEFDSLHRIILHEGEALDFLKRVPSNTIKLVITSPPYNVGKEYETRKNISEYLSTQKPIICELVRTLHEQGSICWQVGNYVDDGEVFPLDIFYYPIFKDLGMKLRNRIIWHFGHGLHASKRFSGRYETVLWFSKSPVYTFNLDSVRIPSKYPGKTHFKGPKAGLPSGNPLGKNPSDIWQFVSDEWENQLWDIPNVKSNHPEKTEHPCQFPIELVERCVLALTQEDDWVLDPYCGAGSSLIAGLKHNRRVVGCEREPQYNEITRERIDLFYHGELGYRPMGTAVHQPTGREKVSKVPEEWESNRSTNQ